MLTPGQRFREFYDTLTKCSHDILTLDEAYIETYIFEDYDTGIISFFHDNTLKVLLDDGIIDDDILQSSRLLREKVFKLQENKEWNMEMLYESDNWEEVICLTEKIKTLVDAKWSEEELQFLFAN